MSWSLMWYMNPVRAVATVLGLGQQPLLPPVWQCWVDLGLPVCGLGVGRMFCTGCPRPLAIEMNGVSLSSHPFHVCHPCSLYLTGSQGHNPKPSRFLIGRSGSQPQVLC